MAGLERALWSRLHFQLHLVRLVLQKDLSGALLEWVRGDDKIQDVMELCLAKDGGEDVNREHGAGLTRTREKSHRPREHVGNGVQMDVPPRISGF